MVEFFVSLGNSIYAIIVEFANYVNLLFKGWADLPGELFVFATSLGPAGDVILSVIGLCVGYLVLRLIITVVELIPGF